MIRRQIDRKVDLRSIAPPNDLPSWRGRVQSPIWRRYYAKALTFQCRFSRRRYGFFHRAKKYYKKATILHDGTPIERVARDDKQGWEKGSTCTFFRLSRSVILPFSEAPYRGHVKGSRYIHTYTTSPPLTIGWSRWRSWPSSSPSPTRFRSRRCPSSFPSA